MQMKTGLISLSLLLSLTACASAKFPHPPASLIQDCPERAVEIRVNGDMAIKILALKEDLASCNADKAGLRAWDKKLGK